jgi:CheY-like chemotaxis protein
MEPLKVLIIEDTRSMRTIIRQCLEKDFKDVTVMEASNGREGQNVLSKRRCNLILCDLDMPEMNGEEFLAWLKTQPKLSSIPIVMITAIRDRDRLIRLIRNGANGCLLKPFTHEALSQKIIDVTANVHKRTHERFEIDGTITVHTTAHSSRARLVDLSMGGLLGRFERASSVPHILDMVKIDLEPASGPVISGMNAYVVRLHADEESHDAEYIKVAVKFHELSEEHGKNLHLFLDSLNRQESEESKH